MSAGSGGAGVTLSLGGIATIVNLGVSSAEHQAFNGASTISVSLPGQSSIASRSRTASGATCTITARGGSGGTLGQMGGSPSYTIQTDGWVVNNPSSDFQVETAGGSPGNAIDGDSLCTISGTGDILGPVIN
jgi:hypothetical protein